MYKLIRIINQNRKQILIAILAIVFAIAFVQILNNNAKKKNQEKLYNLQESVENNKYNTSTYEPSHSVISGGSVSNTTQTKVEDIINKFINSCNEGKIQTAYELLSTNCKQELYPTLEKFKELYYEQNFKTKKQYSIQLWISEGLIYKVELYNDALSTGKIETDNAIQDFYSIVKEDGETKLNISEYIGKQDINKQSTNNGITIKVNYKNIYKDYETYNITIENATENSILLSSGESTKSIYLKGNSGANYTAYIHEINSNAMQLNSYYKITTNIKFNKQYSTSSVDSIVFKDIILDANEYKSMKNKVEYKNRLEIEIDI